MVIAMAVMHRPKLLIADEATSALDPASQDEILALFRQLNAELQMAIRLLSSSSLNFSKRLLIAKS